MQFREEGKQPFAIEKQLTLQYSLWCGNAVTTAKTTFTHKNIANRNYNGNPTSTS